MSDLMFTHAAFVCTAAEEPLLGMRAPAAPGEVEEAGDVEDETEPLPGDEHYPWLERKMQTAYEKLVSPNVTLASLLKFQLNPTWRCLGVLLLTGSLLRKISYSKWACVTASGPVLDDLRCCCCRFGFVQGVLCASKPLHVIAAGVVIIGICLLGLTRFHLETDPQVCGSCGHVDFSIGFCRHGGTVLS